MKSCKNNNEIFSLFTGREIYFIKNNVYDILSTHFNFSTRKTSERVSAATIRCNKDFRVKFRIKDIVESGYDRKKKESYYMTKRKMQIHD